MTRINVHTTAIKAFADNMRTVTLDSHRWVWRFVEPNLACTKKIIKVNGLKILEGTKCYCKPFLVSDVVKPTVRLSGFCEVECWNNKRMVRSIATQGRKLFHVIFNLNRISRSGKGRCQFI
ncbi:MAG: hypothetical protein COB29_13310 [Sulfitobacter sp.]|nr:MAG: hypothetical protein COB29_13310 [Sulfitobacter sp.]